MSQRIRSTVVISLAAVLLVGAGVWGAAMFRADARHDRPTAADLGPLTVQQYDAAVRVAQREIDREQARITSATAILRAGRVRQGNMSGRCRSGHLVEIRLVGRFPHITTGGTAGDTHAPTGRVTLVGITTDAATGQACRLGVGTGRQRPDKGNVADLMPALRLS
jgi:hypothetical protein